MKQTFIGAERIFLEKVDSTNDYASKKFKSGAITSGAVVVAAFQTHGKGQRENQWQADASANLLMSITADLNLWKIQSPISLNHIVALSIVEFLEQHTTDVCIKWPNDIMVANQKIAGILIETQLSSNMKKAVIGFGININQTKFKVPRATSLILETQEEYNTIDLIPEVIAALNRYIAIYQKQGERHLHEMFDQKLWKLNQIHPFIVNGDKKTGYIQSTSMQGELIVNHNQKNYFYSNGEVKY